MDSFQVILAQWAGGVGIAFADGVFLSDLAQLSFGCLREAR